MPTFTGKTFSSFYKNILGLNQSSNTGVDATTRVVHDGAGQSTSISLSDDVLGVQPVNDDTVNTFLVRSKGGSNILKVDTTNSIIRVGASQVAANTQYIHFNVHGIEPLAGRHYAMALGTTNYATAGLSEDVILGTGTDPATTLDISAATGESILWAQCYWYLPDAITLDFAIVLSGGNNAGDSGLNFHIMSYTLDTSSSHGDLSGGAVVADSSVTSAIDEDVIKTTSLTIQSADIASGKVLLATLETDSAYPLSSRMIVKYHIQ